MTIAVNAELPVNGSEAGVQISMSPQDAVQLIEAINGVIKGDVTPAEILTLLKDAIASKLQL